MKRPAAPRQGDAPKAHPKAQRRRQPLPAPLPGITLAVGSALIGTKPISVKRARTLAATIYAELRQELVSLQRLPDEAVSESEIARAYGVSRTPVREAILKLADEGLIEIFPQSGIVVSRIPMAELPEAILIRKALEETTARIAATRITASQGLGLQSLLQSQRETCAAEDRDGFHRADEAFHAMIADIAGYPGIWTLIQQVKVHVDRYRRLTLPQPGRMERAIAEHEAIVAAIIARDPQGAVAAVDRHLEGLLTDISATRELNPDLFQQSRHAAHAGIAKSKSAKASAVKAATGSTAASRQKRRGRPKSRASTEDTRDQRLQK